MECTFHSRLLTLRRPLVTAWGRLHEREIIEVVLRDHDGAIGHGEAAPLEPYDGVPSAAVAAALDAYAVILGEADMRADRPALLARCAAERPLAQALAAIDMALWDIDAKRADVPLAQLIAGLVSAADAAPEPLTAIAVNAVIGATDRDGAAREAADHVERGYRTLKVKVGVGDDAGRLAAVRAAAGPDVSLRADANGAWADAHEALANLRALEPAGLEFCEEPVHGEGPLRELRGASGVAIAMDETDAPGSGAADVVVLKLSRGGISAVLADAAAARAAGSEIVLASTFDGPVGIAASLHVAAALAPPYACGLATLEAFTAPPDGRLRMIDGAIAVPSGAGLLN